jgi:diguanylate cyclase (GGDEF)-like protein
MSLIRQVWLLLLLSLSVIFLGAVGVSVHSARHYLDTQLTLKNNDAAQSLALSMSQQKGDLLAIELEMASQFDTGAYQRIELLTSDGKMLLTRRADVRSGQAPSWFVAWLRIEPELGVAQVSDGWKQVGRLEVMSQVDFAYDELWHSTWVTVGLLSGVALVVGLLALQGVNRIRRPLDAVVRQATALTERRFVTVDEPATPELRDVTRAMNAMVVRLKSMFDEQAGQVDLLRRQANCDPLTGVFNRSHFMSRLRGMLDSEDGASTGALVLVRLTELQELNRVLGHAMTDKMLQAVASAITESAGRAGSTEVGRLNGSDFALILPNNGSLREPAVDVAASLQHLLKGHDVESSAVVGAVRWSHGAPISSLLAAADQALARAEARGAYAVELDDSGDGPVLGEDAWRHSMEQAIVQQRLHMVDFPVVNAINQLVHRECPVRIRLDEVGPWLTAAQWLPMARRLHLTARIDLAAVDLALRAIAADGIPRSVNLSPGSLPDSGFVPGLRALLSANAGAAAQLWLEVAESGAMRQFAQMRELVNQAHAFGARVGLEHAGSGLAESETLLGAGLDFVKLDASFTAGLAGDGVRAQHVASSVRMLHGIGVLVFAEGVSDLADLDALWQTGVDGATGPAVRQTAG